MTMQLRKIADRVGLIAVALIIVSVAFYVMTTKLRPVPRGRGRTAPVCAVQDCATGARVDDGCSDDGRCLSCVNMCPPPTTSARTF
jgi:hypothetical protein